MSPVHCPPYTPMIEVLEPKMGPKYCIVHFTLTEHQVDIEKIRKSQELGYHTVEELEAGTYVSLQELRDYPDTNPGDYTVWMSDTPHERKTCMPLIENARGDVLIAGLGLGMVLIPLLQDRRVNSVTVIERDPEIIAMVAPEITRYIESRTEYMPLLKIIEADAFYWEPNSIWGYETIWLDIWPTITPLNLPQMAELKEKYSGYLTSSGWIGVWSEDQAMLMKQAEEGDEEALKFFMSPRDRMWLEQGVDILTGKTKEDYEELYKVLERFKQEFADKGYIEIEEGIWHRAEEVEDVEDGEKTQGSSELEQKGSA